MDLVMSHTGIKNYSLLKAKTLVRLFFLNLRTTNEE